jgi:effector-binding domain-containing protein
VVCFLSSFAGQFEMADASIIYKKLEPFQIAFIKARIDIRDEIPTLLAHLKDVCGDAICGDPLVIFHNGAVKDGYLVEISYPVARPVETGQVRSRMLESSPALIMLHYGPQQTIRETVLKVYDYLDAHAWTTSLFRREVYRVLDSTRPDMNVTEVQVILHEWDRLLAAAAEKLLGAEASQHLLQGIESITPETSSTEYTSWIQGAIARLDELTRDSEKKCLLLSHCAHVFPQEALNTCAQFTNKARLTTFYGKCTPTTSGMKNRCAGEM